MIGRSWRALSLFALMPFLLAASGDYVRIELLQPSTSPYSLLRYEIVDRGQVTAAVHRRVLAGTDEDLHGAGLFTKEESRDIWENLTQNHALKLKTIGSKKQGLRWRVALSLKGKTHTFEVTDPIGQRNRRYWRIFSKVRTAVSQVTGKLPFRNVYFPKHQTGWLHIQSIPTARVFVDGHDTKLFTPLFLYKVSTGQHTIELRTEEHNLRRTYRIKVEPMTHLRLNLDLR